MTKKIKTRKQSDMITKASKNGTKQTEPNKTIELEMRKEKKSKFFLKISKSKT